MIWENERTTNDNVNRLIEHHYLQQAHEDVDLAHGRGNRIVFLTRTGLTLVLKKGQVREEDIAYYWRGEGHWQPLYSTHNVAVHDVLCAFIKRASEHPEKAIDMRLDPHALLGDRDQESSLISPLSSSNLIPDRIFAVKYHDQVAEFYVEVDLGTESQKTWREKLEKYRMSPEVMGQAGVYVLCVANSQSRLNTLLNWSHGWVDDRFLFSSLEQVCYTYSRKGKDLVLVSEGDPFGPIWRVTTDQERHTLFEHS